MGAYSQGDLLNYVPATAAVAAVTVTAAGPAETAPRRGRQFWWEKGEMKSVIFEQWNSVVGLLLFYVLATCKVITGAAARLGWASASDLWCVVDLRPSNI